MEMHMVVIEYFWFMQKVLIVMNIYVFSSFVPSWWTLIHTLMVCWCFFSCVWFCPTCVDSYHPKYILYVSYEAQKFGK
jgi:hypothetical protein